MFHPTFVPSDDEVFSDKNEVNLKSKNHPRVNGIQVAISPVTNSDQADQDGLTNLQQLCRYLLFHTTFKHSWVNDLQYRMGGEIEFATLGLSEDITNSRFDPSFVVPPTEALE